MFSPRLTAAIAALAIAPMFATTASADEPKAETTTDLDGAILETRVYFEFDKTALSDRAKTELDEAAMWAANNPEAMLIVEGHTDKVGDLPYNRELSDARADATRDYLIATGVSADRIRVMPYGEALPAVPTDKKERANRRIRIYSVHTEPIVKTETKTEIKEVPVTETRLIRERVVEEVPATVPLRYSLSLGGGVLQSLDGSTRQITDIGGTWNLRFTAGTRALLGAEIAYVGSAQDIDNEMGLGDSATLMANGAEGAVRIGVPNVDLQPYAFAGVGMTRYSLVDANADLDDSVVFFPAGIGVAYRTNNLVFDIRGTARAAFDDEMFAGMTNDDDNSLSNWSTSAQLGYEF